MFIVYGICMASLQVLPTGDEYKFSSSKLEDTRNAFLVAKRNAVHAYEMAEDNGDDVSFDLDTFKLEYKSVILDTIALKFRHPHMASLPYAITLTCHRLTYNSSNTPLPPHDIVLICHLHAIVIIRHWCCYLQSNEGSYPKWCKYTINLD